MISLELAQLLKKHGMEQFQTERQTTFTEAMLEVSIFEILDWLEKEKGINDFDIWKTDGGYLCTIEKYNPKNRFPNPMTEKSYEAEGKSRQEAFENAVIKVLES